MDEYPPVSTVEVISFLAMLSIYAVSPLASIWALNTLFSTGIPISFKTWLAGLILVLMMRFVLGGGKKTIYSSAYDDDEFDDEFDEEDDWYEDEEIPGPKAKLIVHPGKKDSQPKKD